jgi:hypothetical protein
MKRLLFCTARGEILCINSCPLLWTIIVGFQKPWLRYSMHQFDVNEKQKPFFLVNLFENQRNSFSCSCSLRKQNQRTAKYGYFKNLKRTVSFHERTSNEITQFFNLRIMAISQNWVFWFAQNRSYEWILRITPITIGVSVAVSKSLPNTGVFIHISTCNFADL